MKLRSKIVLTLLLTTFVSSAATARADDATDQTLASIEAAVKAGKASAPTIEHWIALLNDDATPITIKERAAWGLGMVGAKDKRTIPALLKGAEHKGLLVRSAAVNSLIRLRAQAALPILEHIAREDAILSLRRNATLGLGLLESDQAIKPLVDLSEDKTPDVRGAAALAMSALQSKRNNFIEAIQSMTTDDNPYVQERAKDGLLIAQGKNASVRELLSSTDQDIRLFAALFFLRHGTKADLKAVQAAYDGESDDDVRKMLADANVAIKKRSASKKTTRHPKKKSAHPSHHAKRTPAK
jgi:HEAT repeat protein